MKHVLFLTDASSWGWEGALRDIHKLTMCVHTQYLQNTGTHTHTHCLIAEDSRRAVREFLIGKSAVVIGVLG